MPDRVAEVRTEVDPGQDDVHLVPVVGAECHAIGRGPVDAIQFDPAGPNIPLAGDADLADGELDLVLLRDEDRERLLAYVVGRVESASALMPSLDVRRGRRIRMVPPAGWPLRIDDELVDLDEDADSRAVDILLRPGVVQVVGGRPSADRS